MSVFTSLVVDTVALPPPAEVGTTVQIRKLAPGHLRAAQRASMLRSIADLREMGGAAFLKEIQALSADTVKAAVADDPLMLYDIDTLLQKGITGWSLDADHKDPAVLADLADDIQTVIARAILKLAKPSLFQTEDEQQADRKNG